MTRHRDTARGASTTTTASEPPAPAAADAPGLAWDTSFEQWLPGPGDALLRAYSDAVNRRLLERWLPPSTGRILKTDLFDEAVGTGLAGFLLERAERVSGIDVAPSVVAAASRAEPRLEAAVADVRALPYADGTFDAVVSASTLDHFESAADIERALAELCRVLRPGGSLVVSLDNAANPLVAVRNALPPGLLRRTGLVPYPTGATCGLKELSRLVEQAGLVVEDADAIMHVPRLAVRAAGRSVAGNPERTEGLVARLLAAEPPRRFPLGNVSGQFAAVHATRPALPGEGRQQGRSRNRAPTGPLAGGPRTVAMRILGRTVYRRLELLERPLHPPYREIEARVPLEIGFLGECDVNELAALRPELGSAGVRARFARGDRCFGARHEGRIVAASWVATGVARIDYLGLALALPPRTAFRYDVWTEPRMRGLNIAAATGSILVPLLAGEGIETVTATVLTENREGMHVALRGGFRPAGVVGWIGVGPLRRPFRRPPNSA